MRLITKSDRLAYRQAVVPKNAVLHPRSSDTAAVFTIINSAGRHEAMGFIGTSGRSSFYYVFKTEELMNQYVDNFFDGQDKVTRYHEERRRARNTRVNTLKVGDILNTMWGYDQTNIEFFQVTRLVSEKSVAVREIAGTVVETGFMCGEKTAQPNQFVGPEKVCRVYGDSCSNVDGGGHSGTRTSSLSKHCSWYA